MNRPPKRRNERVDGRKRGARDGGAAAHSARSIRPSQMEPHGSAPRAGDDSGAAGRRFVKLSRWRRVRADVKVCGSRTIDRIRRKIRETQA
jgi:hypothetical protein